VPKAIVLFDAVAWYDEDGVRQEADRYAEVELPQSEFDRLSALGAVEKISRPRATGGAES
jgi:hypothetical protein